MSPWFTELTLTTLSRYLTIKWPGKLIRVINSAEIIGVHAYTSCKTAIFK
jgi:hypothetical protein